MPASADSYQPSLLEKKCSVSFSAPICVLNHLLLVSSADNLFKRLGPRSDPAKLSCENGAHVKSRVSLRCWGGKFFFFFFKCAFLFFNFLSYFYSTEFSCRNTLKLSAPKMNSYTMRHVEILYMQLNNAMFSHFKMCSICKFFTIIVENIYIRFQSLVT